MFWLRHIYWRLRGVLRKSRVEREVDEELRFYIHMRTQENISRGMTADEARRDASRRFGNFEHIKDLCREERGGGVLETVLQDVRFGSRILVKGRAVTLAAVLSLALGIGANTAIFSVVNAVLLSPLPYEDPERIVSLWHTSAARGITQMPFSETEFIEYRDQCRTLERVAAFTTGSLNLTGIEEPVRVGAAEASANLFSVLGGEPQFGRTFSPEEEQPGRGGVVIVSHRLWQRHLGSDPNLLGKGMILNGRSRTVVGVMPPDFQFPNHEVDLWLPLTTDPAAANLEEHYLSAVARLKSGATPEQARVEMETVHGRIRQRYPEYYKDDAGPGVSVIPLHEQVVGETRPVLLILFGAVGFMLLIACANVANLLLARAAARHNEVAVRISLGASRARIVRQFLTESLLLSALGGGAGLLLASWGLGFLLSQGALDLPTRGAGLDGWVLGFTILASLLTGLIFGLAPAIHASKPDLNEALKEGGRGSTGGLRGRTRSLLLVSEVALSVVLLVGAGLMIRSLISLLTVDPGFSPENVLTMRLTLPSAKYTEGQQVTDFYRQLLGRVEALPGVQSGAVVNQLPLAPQRLEASFEIEGRVPGDRAAVAEYRMISPGYFHAMGIPLTRGRSFTDLDGEQSPPAVIINQSLAGHFWPFEDPTGKRIRIKEGAPWLLIVGVAGDVKNRGLNVGTSHEMYFPHGASPFGLGPPPRTMTLIVRGPSDPSRWASAVRGEVRVVDKDLPVYMIQTLDQLVAASVAGQRFATTLLSLFATISLLLSAVGVYGVVSYSVAQRKHEIGIRKALGARPRDIFTLVMRQGVVPVLAGVALGGIAAWSLTRVMSGLLYGVRATDPLTFVAIPLLLIAVALLACYLPARRAMRIDPMVALRRG